MVYLKNIFKRHFLLVFFILGLFFLLPQLCFASIADDLIARKGWKKISLDLQSAPLLSILKIFSQQSGLNFVATSNIESRPVTLYLDNVSIRDALDKILLINNLGYELDEESNIFIIKESPTLPKQTITKVYQLRYARVNSSPLNSEGAFNTSGNSLSDAVGKILSGKGNLSEDSRTNSIIITDIPDNFELIEQTIKRLDVSVPKVLIEVEILDVSEDVAENLGVDWPATDIYSYTFPSRSSNFPLEKVRPSGDSGVTITDTLGFTKGSLSAGDAVGLDFVITDTDTKILARPRILTLSHETAEIRISGDEAVGEITTTDESGNVSRSAERMEVGVVLKVTPYANSDTGEITMVVEPNVSSSEASNIAGYFDRQERMTKTTLAMKDGETLVIGGLLKKEESDARKRMPFLGDIPFLGTLFRHKAETGQDRELLVFITPRIMKDENQKSLASSNTNNYQILQEREQKDAIYRKEEIDKILDVWNNK